MRLYISYDESISSHLFITISITITTTIIRNCIIWKESRVTGCLYDCVFSIIRLSRHLRGFSEKLMFWAQLTVGKPTGSHDDRVNWHIFASQASIEISLLVNRGRDCHHIQGHNFAIMLWFGFTLQHSRVLTHTPQYQQMLREDPI